MTAEAPHVIVEPLPYEAKLESRALADIDLAVIHCTELPDMAMAREYGERVLYAAGTGNSGHYYVDRDGGIHRYVALDRTAHHVRGYNPRSVGIELVNTGRYPDWLAADNQHMREPYADAQIDALAALLRHLQSTLPNLRFIAGHEELDREEVPASDDPAARVRRKLDPGPLFPWERVMRDVVLERLPASP